MGLTRSFVITHLVGLLISSVSALEVGVEILDEETKEPLGLPYLKVCRPPDSNPAWGPIVIDPLVTFCELQGPEASLGVGMESDWKIRTSSRRPEGDLKFTYLNLAGPMGISMSNDPDRAASSWFGYGTNSYKNHEASVFEVAREDADGNRVPQTINFENPLQVGDILEWAGPSGFEGDYQLRIGSNTEGGVQRIMRSDKPVHDYLPIRLVVLELHETEVLEELLPERVVRNPGQQSIGQSYLPDQRPEAAARKSQGFMGSMWNKVTNIGSKKVPEKEIEESKEEIRYNDPSESKVWDPKYENPFDKPYMGSRINKDVVKDELESKSMWNSFWGGKGKDKDKRKGTEDVIPPRPITHARQPIRDEDTEAPEKKTGVIRSLIDRVVPKIKVPDILSGKADKDYPLAKPVEAELVSSNVPVDVPKEVEELVEENVEEDEDNVDTLAESTFYGKGTFGSNLGPGNDVL
ncbi:hypothetical protein TWF506_005571 [Arthrobotrys conoides]|uniref:Uncharacterized protein n=1 Tax=Arthrobotrys conoides TaxID=74498 RepID=A0AAN8NPJ4_9PEZI